MTDTAAAAASSDTGASVRDYDGRVGVVHRAGLGMVPGRRRAGFAGWWCAREAESRRAFVLEVDIGDRVHTVTPTPREARQLAAMLLRLAEEVELRAPRGVVA